jgi:ABC-type Fe3+-hydroxamate transport system substrate-binding protein
VWRQLTDDLGRPVLLPAPPRRIVSLVPSLTELVCALDCADRLVGVTSYCTDPPAVVGATAKVGGTKNPDLRRIFELRPDLVLLNSEENRAEDFQDLAAAGVTLFVSFPHSLDETAASVERLGMALDAGRQATALAGEIRSAGTTAPTHLRRRVFCPIWRKPWMSFNRDTYAHDLLLRAGGANVCAAWPGRYPVVELEVIVPADPEVVLLPSEPYPFSERHRRLLGDLEATSAVRNGRVYLVDGKALFWYGARTAAAVSEFQRLLASA